MITPRIRQRRDVCEIAVEQVRVDGRARRDVPRHAHVARRAFGTQRLCKAAQAEFCRTVDRAALAAAQRRSRVTIVLVSPNTDEAYYQREEIAAAIDWASRSARVSSRFSA